MYYFFMYKLGPNTNGCQFFVTCTATSWLDGDYVGFGKVNIFILSTALKCERNLFESYNLLQI